MRQTWLVPPMLLAAFAGTAAAQVPVRPDTLARDSIPVQELPTVTVTVTRTPETLDRVPLAVGILDRADLQRGQATIGLDEALTNLPGVHVANRYNFSLDQRLSIRGFGSRSNFGVRGVKILLDGVPQTLPDGQSQLTNVDLASIGRAEVIRGSASALYGNASGGVIALTSEPASQAPFAQRIRLLGGGGPREQDGFYKAQSWSSFRSGAVSGTLSLSRFKTDGFRQHSAAEARQLSANLDYLASGSTTAFLRLGLADNPRAENPGALTAAELATNRDSAAANNILRRADKDVQQHQLAVGLRHFDAGGNEYEAMAFGLLRDLKNPLATANYVRIDRSVLGARLAHQRRLGPAERPLRLNLGLDLQRLRDDRQNFLSDAGEPTDSVTVDQLETVIEIGPFAQLLWPLPNGLLVSAGVRYDWVRFDVDDRHLTDGVDNGGARTMAALSGHLGASFARGDAVVPYVNVSTSFETPTTTELVNRPDGTGGFNDLLDPQRAVTLEVGARGQPVPELTYSAAFFLGRITDAIVQFQEIGGRAFFTNAGKTHNDGVELGLSYAPTAWLAVNAAYTYARYRFSDYKVVRGAVTDTLDGNRLPGVPEHFWRFGLRTAPARNVFVDVDHTLSSSVVADDANTLWVDAWGAGVTNVRLSLNARVGGVTFSPFLGVNNVFDRRYVGSVTINGFGGRVFEPAPGRHFYVGGEIGWAAR
ncbi:MAG TPA: TonB-dependent receptor [Gemmatimonadales bacterium]|nr:TonB-dependent receptor [Gemmatimonadales bacterium]